MNLLRQWLQHWIDRKTQEIQLVNKKLEAVIAYDKDKPDGMTIAEYYQGIEQAVKEAER